MVFGFFGHLKENPDFLKVFFLILFIQFAIINVSLLPVKAFTFISAMFSCVPFGSSRLASGLLYGLHHDPGRYDPEGSYADIL